MPKPCCGASRVPTTAAAGVREARTPLDDRISARWDSPSPEQRAAAETGVRRLIEIAQARQGAAKTILDWLNVEFEVLKPTLKLQAVIELDTDAFVAEVKKSRAKGKTLTAIALAALRDEHTRTIVPLRALAAEALAAEQHLSDLVNAGYGLTYRALARDQGNEVIAWLQQQKAILRPKLRRASPTAWREQMYAAIYARAQKLGINKESLYQIAQDRLELDCLPSSLKDLGQRQLDRLHQIIFSL